MGITSIGYGHLPRSPARQDVLVFETAFGLHLARGDPPSPDRPTTSYFLSPDPLTSMIIGNQLPSKASRAQSGTMFLTPFQFLGLP